MKNLKYVFLLSVLFSVASCDYLSSPDDTATVREGFITFPAISLIGEQFVTLSVGDSFEDPGVEATLGTEDISSDVVISGDVDLNTAGVYAINYTVSTVNTLDEQSTVSQQRFIAVVTESASEVNLVGQYNGDGTAIAGSWTQAATVTSISGAWYNIDKALASGNNLGIFFAVVDSPSDGNTASIIVPSQGTGFGTVNTTDQGTNAQLNPDGFQWSLFISCCGVFGPIIFSR